MNEVEKILQDRMGVYGDYNINTILIHKLKRIFRNGKNWELLRSIEKESLDMIASKIGRLLGGTLGQVENDTWHDIAGYALLPSKLFYDKEKE